MELTGRPTKQARLTLTAALTLTHLGRPLSRRAALYGSKPFLEPFVKRVDPFGERAYLGNLAGSLSGRYLGNLAGSQFLAL